MKSDDNAKKMRAMEEDGMNGRSLSVKVEGLDMSLQIMPTRRGMVARIDRFEDLRLHRMITMIMNTLKTTGMMRDGTPQASRRGVAVDLEGGRRV